MKYSIGIGTERNGTKKRHFIFNTLINGRFYQHPSQSKILIRYSFALGAIMLAKIYIEI